MEMVGTRRARGRNKELRGWSNVGMVISGCATAAMDDGRVIEMKAGDVF